MTERTRLGPWAGFLLALAFLTRIPVRLPPAAVGAPLAGAAWAFPLVGIVVGAAGGAVYAGAWAIGLPPALAALLAVAAQLLLTGALHEDGLADTADGFGGGGSVERKLAIMRDSRIGTYGVCAVVLALALRAGAIAALGAPGIVAAALIGSGTLSRLMMIGPMTTLSPARADGLGAGAGKPTPLAALIAIGIALTPFSVLHALTPEQPVLIRLALLVLLLPTLLATCVLGRLAQRQIGGYTGDVLGAVQQVTEIVVLLTAIVIIYQSVMVDF